MRVAACVCVRVRTFVCVNALIKQSERDTRRAAARGFRERGVRGREGLHSNEMHRHKRRAEHSTRLS